MLNLFLIINVILSLNSGGATQNVMTECTNCTEKYTENRIKRSTDPCETAGTVADSEWSCWASWTSCSSTCGGLGTRSRRRSCTPGTDSIGSQSVTCAGDAFEQESCGSDLSCPDPHCPDGYQYSHQ